MRAGTVTIVVLVAAAIIVVATGRGLARNGRPYGELLVNVHKLVDLSALVAIGVMLYRMNHSAPLPVHVVSVITIAAVAVLAGFVTGGLITAVEHAPAWVAPAHRIVSWLILVLAAVSVYFVQS
jgi:hypothetical protein